MLNISNGCNEGNETTCNVTAANWIDEDVKYRVMIHDSKSTLNNDLHSTDPFVIVETKKNKVASISKSNLDSISTEDNICAAQENTPGAADETLIRTDCQMRKVI